MDRLDELRIFAAIAEAGSLVGAARRLRRSTPAITRALTRLEGRIGVRLVERTTRRLSLTKAGRDFAEQARAIVSQYDVALHGLDTAPLRGLVRLTAPVLFGRMHVMPLIASFLDAFPEIQIDLVLNDRNLDLIDGGLDVALRIGTLADSSLVTRKVGEVRRLTVVNPDYLRARGTPRKPADLTAHDLISGGLPTAEREWRFEAHSRGADIQLSPKLRVNDVESQLFAVRTCRGIARLLSYQVMDDLAAGRLVRILREYERPPLPVQLVTPSAAHMAPKVRAFLDYATKFLRTLPAINAEYVAAAATSPARSTKKKRSRTVPSSR